MTAVWPRTHQLTTDDPHQDCVAPNCKSITAFVCLVFQFSQKWERERAMLTALCAEEGKFSHRFQLIIVKCASSLKDRYLKLLPVTVNQVRLEFNCSFSQMNIWNSRELFKLLSLTMQLLVWTFIQPKWRGSKGTSKLWKQEIIQWKERSCHTQKHLHYYNRLIIPFGAETFSYSQHIS